MIGILLISTLFVFLLSLKLTKRVRAVFFASVSFGTIPFILDFTRKVMSDLPAITLFLAGLYLFILGHEKETSHERHYVLSSIFMGFSFIVRFDIAIMVFPIIVFLLLKERKDFLFYFVPLVLIARFLELVSSYLYFGQLIYPLWEFFYSNFFTTQFVVSRISGVNIFVGFFT